MQWLRLKMSEDVSRDMILAAPCPCIQGCQSESSAAGSSQRCRAVPTMAGNNQLPPSTSSVAVESDMCSNSARLKPVNGAPLCDSLVTLSPAAADKVSRKKKRRRRKKKRLYCQAISSSIQIFLDQAVIQFVSTKPSSMAIFWWLIACSLCLLPSSGRNAINIWTDRHMQLLKKPIDYVLKKNWEKKKHSLNAVFQISSVGKKTGLLGSRLNWF